MVKSGSVKISLLLISKFGFKAASKPAIKLHTGDTQRLQRIYTRHALIIPIMKQNNCIEYSFPLKRRIPARNTDNSDVLPLNEEDMTGSVVE